MSKVKFVQGPCEGILPFSKEFSSFEEAKKWVLQDKEDYGDVLNYGGKFEGLTDDQIESLKNLTLDDALASEESEEKKQ